MRLSDSVCLYKLCFAGSLYAYAIRCEGYTLVFEMRSGNDAWVDKGVIPHSDFADAGMKRVHDDAEVQGVLLNYPLPPGMSPYYIQPRNSVMAFARAMERVLRRHDKTKGGQENWRKDSPESLMLRVQDEAKELSSEFITGCMTSTDRVTSEAVDVANMAMMVWDSVARLVEASDSPPVQEIPF
jgi:hypothetical protein